MGTRFPFPVRKPAPAVAASEVPVAPFIYINGHTEDDGIGIAHSLKNHIPTCQVVTPEEFGVFAKNHAPGSSLREAAEQYGRNVVFENIRDNFESNSGTVFVFVDERFRDFRKDRKVVKEFQHCAKKRGSTFVSVILTSFQGDDHRRTLVSLGGNKEIQAMVVSNLNYMGQMIYEQLCKNTGKPLIESAILISSLTS